MNRALNLLDTISKFGNVAMFVT